MIVLGLFGFGTNPGACLLRDGRVVAFAEEERFTRFKGSHGLFPGRAVAFCLARAGVVLDEVDRVAFAWDTSKYPYRMLVPLAREYVRHRRRAQGGGSDATLFQVVSSLLKYTPGRLREDLRLGLRAAGIAGRCPPVEFVPHHLAHSYSAYFLSPFDEALVLTLDGSGEEICTQVALGRGGRLDVKGSLPIPHSLGWYYAAFTAYFGFAPYGEEGKLMGLAGLGHARSASNPWPERLARVLRVEDGGYSVDPIYTRFGGHSYAERFTDALAELVTAHDPALAPLVPNHNGAPPRYLEPAWVDLAWGVQRRLEEAALAVARRAVREHGVRNLCLAGGVALNCKMNGALLAGAGVERVFVQPASYDAGAALGAALVVAHGLGDDVRHPMRNAFWGPEWSDEELGALLDRVGLSAERCDDVADRVAGELAAGRVVGWFQGRMEAGPRALGARSILADPRASGVRDRVNRDVKGREPWRPLCPSILAGREDELLVGAAPAPFMTTAFEVRPERLEELSQVAHADGTTRPQVVDAEGAPLFHRLLSRFEARTGTPCVLNTSLNVAGEPLVCAPREALRAFYSTGLDALALGPYLLRKA